MSNYTAPDYKVVLENVKGRKGLRTQKPKNCGFSAYVWRMARFHGGIDMTMPVMCEFDLANYADHSYTKGDKDQFKALRTVADQMADNVCKDLGLDNTRAARRWGRALGYL
jgi:hypothetical protein